MARASKKPTAKKQAVTTRYDVRLHDEMGFMERSRPILAFLALAITVVAGLWAAWQWGRAQVVSTDDLKVELRGFEDKVNDKISTTKNEVIHHTEAKAKESKQDIDSVKDKLGVVGKDVRQSMLISLETSVRTLWSQVAQQKTTLGNIKMLKNDKPNDAFLIQREAEVEQLIRTLETQLNNAQAQLERVRIGN